MLQKEKDIEGGSGAEMKRQQGRKRCRQKKTAREEKLQTVKDSEGGNAVDRKRH